MREAKPPAAKVEQSLTRESLLDGSFLRGVRAAVARIGRSDQVRTDAQIEALVAAAMAARPKAPEIWIFAYGSLMWNTTFHFTDRRKATLPGWHRRFCLWSPIGRGTPEHPCLTLALDEGGQTEGVAFRLPLEAEHVELGLTFRREMFGNTYIDRWVTVETADGPRDAITFVVNREFRGYAGRITNEEIAAAIASATGSSGTCMDYFSQTLEHLRQLEIVDSELEEIGRLLSGHLSTTALI